MYYCYNDANNNNYYRMIIIIEMIIINVLKREQEQKRTYHLFIINADDVYELKIWLLIWLQYKR